MVSIFIVDGVTVKTGFLLERRPNVVIKRNGGALKKSSEYSESFNPKFSFLKSLCLLNLVSKKDN